MERRSELPPAGTALQARLLWAVLVLVLAGVLGAYVVSRVLPPNALVARSPDAELPVYGQVADFTLTDQLGRTVRRSDFDGSSWVADFIFTRCSGPCPLITANMARLADSLGAASAVRFASFSIDPERDTPEALRKYAERFGADNSTWRFLTGERRVIADLARNSFRVAVEMPEPAATRNSKAGGGQESGASTVAASPDSTGFYDIPHTLRFTLVDARGRIRGYYDGADQESIAQLYRDIHRLRKTAS